VLTGHYLSEDRFLLEAQVQHDSQHEVAMIAVNDFVLLPGDKAQMITFDLYINGYFAYNLRADGLIVATPTGSTAYALSGGGPILHPNLDAIVLVPLCPHTLSSRPLVVKSDSDIRIHISDSNYTIPQISHDGQRRIPVPIGADISVTRHTKSFRLIHPMNYHYFHTLSTKLHWKG
jgi:NAD+ kinase